jgi:hypothetical protein
MARFYVAADVRKPLTQRNKLAFLPAAKAIRVVNTREFPSRHETVAISGQIAVVSNGLGRR